MDNHKHREIENALRLARLTLTRPRHRTDVTLDIPVEENRAAMVSGAAPQPEAGANLAGHDERPKINPSIGRRGLEVARRLLGD